MNDEPRRVGKLTLTRRCSKTVRNARSAYRDVFDPGYRYNFSGCRVARTYP